VQARARYPASLILRSYRKGDQFGTIAGARPDAEANLFRQQGITGARGENQALAKAALVVVFSARRLCHYFQSFTVIVMTNLPIRKVLQKPDVAGRMAQWAVELSKFDIHYEPRGHIKGQIYANFVVELSSVATHQEGADFRWVLSVDGSSNQQGSGAGVILEGPDGLLIEQALRFAFKANNNQAEYEALIAGMLLLRRWEQRGCWQRAIPC